MEVLIAAMLVSTLNMACFFVGLKTGQKVSKGEEVKVPELNPLKKYLEYKEKQEVEKEHKKLETILENIERYDGTSSGQKDIPE